MALLPLLLLYFLSAACFAKVEPVMKRVIGPYVFEGGGAKSLNYQSLVKDLARATLEIPFNIPPYFALITRALGILEGDGNRKK